MPEVTTFEKIKEYAQGLQNDVNWALRNGISPENPLFLYGRKNEVFLPFTFSYSILPNGEIEYRSRLAEEGAKEQVKTHTLLPSPPVGDVACLLSYIRACEELLGLPQKEFDMVAFIECVEEFAADFERIRSMNKRH